MVDNRANVTRRPRNPKTSELIARDLATKIVEAGLQEGATLATEKQMVEDFGVGRTTIREALRLLETRGVLTIRSGPKGGPVIRRPRPEDLGEALTLILQFEKASLSDVLDARRALEPMIARLAAERMNDDHLAVLEETVQLMLDNLDGHEVFLAQNSRFHSTVAAAAGSVVLRVFSDTLKSIADGAVIGVQYTPRRRRAVAEAHARVVDAFTQHAPDQAEAAMRAHIEEAAEYWRRAYGSLLTNPVRWIH